MYYRKRQWQLNQCPAGSYFVDFRSVGMRHGSFSDPEFYNGGADSIAGEARLELIERVVLAFLNQTLEHQDEPLLKGLGTSPSDILIHSIGAVAR